jgi:hypothetical protein
MTGPDMNITASSRSSIESFALFRRMVTGVEPLTRRPQAQGT